MNANTQKVSDTGVSIWLDDLNRDRITTGNLRDLTQTHNVVGVTTNPSIFQKALSNIGPYDEQLAQLAKNNASVEEAVRAATTEDVKNACDIMSDIFNRSQYQDGRVSIEVEPHLAHNTKATEIQAQELWKTVNRPNAMIKIPATIEGLPAITTTLAKGISVNVTLVFSIARDLEVVKAYIDGIEAADKAGFDLSKIASVSSFFVSRVDTTIDKLLDDIDTNEAKNLKGKAAVANARIAYAKHAQAFANDPRWAALEAKGAKKQRLLWASTGVKNPAYSDTMYVDDLCGKLIVNTMPEATLMAVADHSKASGDSLSGKASEAETIIANIEKLGISMKLVTNKLEADGVEAFITSWTDLLANVKAGLTRNKA
ncbi:MAG: transaldolase [Bifidobacteriaceae bacterium]|jgi:transaldolase|nr:transaldolase [Bifidobacteriaceae bacterium]